MFRCNDGRGRRCNDGRSCLWCIRAPRQARARAREVQAWEAREVQAREAREVQARQGQVQARKARQIQEVQVIDHLSDHINAINRV